MTAILSYYVLVGASLLALVSGDEEHLQFSGSGHHWGQKYNRTYVIDCDRQLDGKCNNLSLEQISVAMQEHFIGYNTVKILAPQLMLTGNVSFFGLNALTISGNADIGTNITCQCEFAGLIFSDIAMLTIQHLVVVNCGAIPMLQSFAYSSAVTIFHSRNVTIVDLTITESMGIGLTILGHQGGIVQVKSSKFLENKVSANNSFKGGGGVYVAGFEQDPGEHIMYWFDDCTFEGNVAHTKYFDYLYTNDLGDPVVGYGRGGGGEVRFEGNLTDIDTFFSNCVFRKNKAFEGSGLALKIRGVPNLKGANKVFVRVEHSLFEDNGVDLANLIGNAGGLLIDLKRTNPNSNHNVVIHNVTFRGNVAQFGGGLYFYSDVDSYKSAAKQTNIVTIDKCTFENNTAHTGAAVDITPHVFQRMRTGVLTTPLFRDCIFSNNNIQVNNQINSAQTTFGIGTVYVSLYDISFQGHNRFENNSGTAIHIVNGNIDLSQSSVYIYNNSGIQGGGVTLIGQASVIVGPNKSYEFINNTALGKGGGLYVQLNDNHDITASKTCFIQYCDAISYTIPVASWSAKINFRGNRAKAGTGHAIFATSLYPCQTINTNTIENPTLETVNASEVFTVRGITVEEDEMLCGHQIATEGALLHGKGDFLIEVVPGETFSHGVNITDDLEHTTEVVLTASIPDNLNVDLDPAFSSCIGKHLALEGKQNETAKLYLQTTTSRMSYVELEVQLTDCPPGFKFNNITHRCVCNYQEYYGFVKCDTTFHSYITVGFWAGIVTDARNESRQELVTSYCPLKFCNYNGTVTNRSAVRLPQVKHKLNVAMCGRYRTGISCGHCAQGYTTYYHSPKYACMPVDPTLCKLGWFFYILSELVPVTLIFIIILVLNVSFTSGAVNGFIFFSQVLTTLHADASGLIVLSPAVNTLVRGYQIIYGFFNLHILEMSPLSFCLVPNASTLDIHAFKYVTIIYALFLVILVIWLMNKCHSITEYFGKCCRITTVKTSIIHGLSAFLVLCYSQSLMVSLHLLRGYHLVARQGSDLRISRRVWLNGNMVYFSREHLLYALPALFFLLTIGIFPPIILLAYPLLNRFPAFCNFEESRILKFISYILPVSSLKPLIDTFQGCFKDNVRFFAGLYFLYRFILLLFDVFIDSFSNFYTAVEALFITIALLHTIFQPYAQRWHNIIDALLFADLALINVITLAHYSLFRTSVGRQAVIDLIGPSVAIQLLLIYLPFTVMTLYVLVLICKFMYRTQNLIVPLPKIKSTNMSFGKLKELVRSNSGEDSLESEALPHRMIAGEVNYECYEDNEHTNPKRNCNVTY